MIVFGLPPRACCLFTLWLCGNCFRDINSAVHIFAVLWNCCKSGVFVLRLTLTSKQSPNGNLSEKDFQMSC